MGWPRLRAGLFPLVFPLFALPIPNRILLPLQDALQRVTTTASELVIQTLVGSAKMLRETGTHPAVLREQVTSPGGTTASALRELEIHKVRAAFLAAMEAARDRSRALAEGS